MDLDITASFFYKQLLSQTYNYGTIQDAEGVTKRRTSAASALSARWLARNDPKILAVCGSGHQGYSHIQVLINQYRLTIKEIRIWNHRKVGAEKMAAKISGWADDHVKITTCDEIAGCTRGADLIVTATFSPNPYLDRSMVSNGTHIMAVGAARPHLSELDPELLRNAEVSSDIKSF